MKKPLVLGFGLFRLGIELLHHVATETVYLVKLAIVWLLRTKEKPHKYDLMRMFVRPFVGQSFCLLYAIILPSGTTGALNYWILF